MRKTLSALLLLASVTSYAAPPTALQYIKLSRGGGNCGFSGLTHWLVATNTSTSDLIQATFSFRRLNGGSPIPQQIVNLGPGQEFNLICQNHSDDPRGTVSGARFLR